MRSRSIVSAAVILVLVYLFRPVFHDFFMSFVISPLSLVALGLVLFGAWRIRGQLKSFRVVPTGSGNVSLKADRLSWRAVSLYWLLIFFVMIGLGIEREARLAVTARAIDYAVRAQLPAFDPIRLTPKAVAQRYADDTFQNPQERLGDSQIVLREGKLKRVFPRLPDGLLLSFVNKLSGFVVVDVGTLERNVAIEDSRFEIAEGIGIFDNLFYRLPLKRFFVDYSNEPIYLPDDQGGWVTVVPYVQYKGFPFTVPQWGGIIVVHQDGSMEDLSPEQAAQRNYLAGNRLHPKELTHWYSESYAYRGGLLNKWFIHRNETEVVSLEGEESILHVSTTEGFKQLVVAEPYGRSYGIYRIFVFDATTGKREILEFDQSSQLTGPIAAADYIRKEFPTYDWSLFRLSEPRPVLRNGSLSWLFSVVPGDAAGIATMAVLDAKTNQVFQAKTVVELQAVLAGSTSPAPTTPSTEPSSAELKVRLDAIQRELDAAKLLVP